MVNSTFNIPFSFSFFLFPNNKFNNTEKEKIFNDISSYIGNDVDFSIRITDEIPENPKNGKRRFMIRKCDLSVG